MLTVDSIAVFLEEIAPGRLSESWDNVGLLVGDRRKEVRRVMTCLTVTPDSAEEAIAGRVELIVTHHPLPFKSMKRLTTDSIEGMLLWNLIAAGVSIYSGHTAYDSARDGINQRFAAGLELVDVAPLVPSEHGDLRPLGIGAGRFGRLREPLRLDQLAERVKAFLAIERLQRVGRADLQLTKVGVACGSGGDFLQAAHRAGCECLVTGETRFHTSLEAESLAMGLILPGHYASERFGVEHLACSLRQRFPQLDVWASRNEQDPLRWQ